MGATALLSQFGSSVVVCTYPSFQGWPRAGRPAGRRQVVGAAGQGGGDPLVKHHHSHHVPARGAPLPWLPACVPVATRHTGSFGGPPTTVAERAMVALVLGAGLSQNEADLTQIDSK